MKGSAYEPVMLVMSLATNRASFDPASCGSAQMARIGTWILMYFCWPAINLAAGSLPVRVALLKLATNTTLRILSRAQLVLRRRRTGHDGADRVDPDALTNALRTMAASDRLNAMVWNDDSYLRLAKRAKFARKISNWARGGEQLFVTPLTAAASHTPVADAQVPR
jgi:hypothetical protein